ncbi:Uncharacterized protein dnm_098770 [Desulfonema magnum]|uniref:Uncharacterized protein n=1 Tax=Desulfonema magnum TaxID=45655 RepID=A0A975BXU1_9BACT|nr:Uncharacterized protein dnm_098770 [Desulfonema magnum]
MSHQAEDQMQFQSTPPVRGATPPDLQKFHQAEFQSTPPVRGATI